MRARAARAGRAVFRCNADEVRILSQSSGIDYKGTTSALLIRRNIRPNVLINERPGQTVDMHVSLKRNKHVVLTDST